jgi:hypothetical protein
MNELALELAAGVDDLLLTEFESPAAAGSILSSDQPETRTQLGWIEHRLSPSCVV